MRRARRYWAAALAAGVLTLAGCGGGGDSFDAEGFVREVNAEGVKLELGKPLLSGQEGQEVYRIALAQVTQLPGEARARPSGSLSVFDDEGGADEEMSTCRGSADLLCYRAANVVVILEGGGVETQQLAVAMERLSED